MVARARPTIDLAPDTGRTVPYTLDLAGPPSFDFGRLQPGESRLLLHPIVAAGATLSIRYDGSPAITLRSSPSDARVALVFVAPSAPGPHRGSLRVDARFAHRSETIAIPVLAHAGLALPDLVSTDAIPFRSRHARDAARARQIALAEAQLGPALPHPRFDAQLARVRDAMSLLGSQQHLGIDRAARELDHAKALPLGAPWLDLAMTALDLASARVGDLIATSIETGLHELARAADPSKPIALADSTIVAVAHATRRGLAVGAWRRTHRRPPTSDPRRAFIELLRIGNSLHERERQDGAHHAAAFLRPLLRSRSALALGALRVIEHALRAEAGHASATYYEGTIRQWLSFLHGAR